MGEHETFSRLECARLQKSPLYLYPPVLGHFLWRTVERTVSYIRLWMAENGFDLGGKRDIRCGGGDV